MLVMFTVVCSYSANPIFADAVSVNENNNLELLQNDYTDTTARLEYYMTINGETSLITENVKTIDDTIIVETTDSISGDTTKTTYKITKNKKSFLNNFQEVVYNLHEPSTASTGTWKSHKETISLKGAQFTVASVGAALAAATGMQLAYAISVGASVVSFLAGIGTTMIPSYIYFKGERCVSRSTGKIYYKYKGNLYKNSGCTKVMAKDLSWSRRWGH